MSLNAVVLHESPPLSLYIHIPWCLHKCPYCDFNSYEIHHNENIKNVYINALIRDIDYETPKILDRQITSIFIGGGTPSLFSPKLLGKLLNAIKLRLNIHPEAEVTIEANPCNADLNDFRTYLSIGINRLSIGVQSFNNKHLKLLERVHNANESHNAIEAAINAGFDKINVDIMFGLPQQTIEEALQDIKISITKQLTHISWYQLTIEPNTIFHAKPPILPNDDDIWDMQSQGKSILEEKGFIQYEISAYAKNKHRCKHNLNYWQFGDYLGIGAGAHSKISNIYKNKVERFVRHKIPISYMELAGGAAVIKHHKKIDKDNLVLEFMINSLRLIDGVPIKLFSAYTGISTNYIKKELSTAKEKGWLNYDKERYRPTPNGIRYLNDLLCIFVRENK